MQPLSPSHTPLVVSGASTSNATVIVQFVLYTLANTSDVLYQHRTGQTQRKTWSCRRILGLFEHLLPYFLFCAHCASFKGTISLDCSLLGFSLSENTSAFCCILENCRLHRPNIILKASQEESQ